MTSLYERTFGERAIEVKPLKGDGSARRIFRIVGESRTSIGIVGENIAENRAFLGFSRAFREAGIPVPEIYAVHESERVYLEQDLGDVTVFDWMLVNRGTPDYHHRLEALYGRIIDILPRFQIDAAVALDYSLCYQTVEFAREQMEFDVRYFAEMFLDLVWQQQYDRETYFHDCGEMINLLMEEPREYFLYRDFQSRNIMLTDGELSFIDYQSGRKGALQYDAASLLFDAKAAIPDAMRSRLLERYMTRVSERIDIDPDRFRRMYYAFAALRVMQAMGAFGNLGVRQGKPGFVSSIPPGQANLRTLVEASSIVRGLPALADILMRVAGDSSLHRYSEQE